MEMRDQFATVSEAPEQPFNFSSVSALRSEVGPYEKLCSENIILLLLLL
jgi:hypothetical protein